MEIKTKLQMYIHDGRHQESIGRELEEIKELYKNRDRKYWLSLKDEHLAEANKLSVLYDKVRESMYSQGSKKN